MNIPEQSYGIEYIHEIRLTLQTLDPPAYSSGEIMCQRQRTELIFQNHRVHASYYVLKRVTYCIDFIPRSSVKDMPLFSVNRLTPVMMMLDYLSIIMQIRGS